MSILRYEHSLHSRDRYEAYLMDVIVKSGAKRVLDIGGGANPLLSAEFIEQHKIDYAILDISELELSKAPASYKKIAADAASPAFTINEKFDVIFSITFMEHIKNAEQFHKNIYTLLSDKGVSIHLFPTLYAFPFLVNMLLPERLTDKLLALFSPRDRTQYAKFPAYYHWCYGPTEAQIKRYARLGYETVEYVGLFGHGGYYKRMPPLRKLHEWKTAYLLKNPIPLLTSYAYFTLRKAK